MGKWAISALFSTFFFVGMPPVVADFDQGFAAHQRGDYATAYREFRRAAEQGDSVAQNNLGYMYEYGEGVPKNDVEATRWYRRAAEQGYSIAQFNLGNRYSLGRGVRKNDAEAVRWYRRAAEQENSAAQVTLGFMYANGQGVPQNDPEAVRWYRKAAEQGNSGAQLNLANMYADGRGVPKNDAEAARWVRRAAAQGNTIAQFNLGVSYAFGRGVQKNDVEAVRWFREAAEKGYSSAQLNLGIMYAEGRGVPTNDVLAYKWTSLALAQGEELARESLGRYERQMPPDRIAEAQRLARAFHARAETVTVGTAPQSRSRSDRPPPVPSATARQIQSHLKALGYDPGPADGLMGPRTATAIRSFQRDAGIEPDGLASTTLEALLAALIEDRERIPQGDNGIVDLKLASTGTGFFINEAGDLLTNQHVIEGCALVRVALPSGSVDGTTVATNASDDLAVIRVATAKPKAVAAFRDTPAALGEDVIVVGYPLRSVLGSAVNATFGSVSSTSGPGGDRRYLQISAPVQQGNSGGPLMDESGAVLGVVVAKLDALSLALATGDIPQNINFGIKGVVARTFLSIHDVEYRTAPAKSRPAGRPAVVSAATGFTVPVECWK